MLAVESAHRLAAAHKAEAKAAPSPTTSDLFTSVFQSARSERAQKQEVAKQQTTEADAAQKKVSQRTSARSNGQTGASAKPKSHERTKPASDKPALKESRADRLRDSEQPCETTHDTTNDQVPDEAPVETKDQAVTDAPVDQVTDAAQPQQNGEPTPSNNPSAQLAVLAEVPPQTMPAQVQEPVAEAHVIYTPQQPAPVNGTKSPKPQAVRSDHASDATSAATSSNKSDSNETTDDNPIPQVGLKPEPNVEFKDKPLPINELPRTHDDGSPRPHISPEPSNNPLPEVDRSHTQAPIRVQAPVLVEGKADAIGVNLNEPKSISELAHVLRATTGKDQSTMLLKLDPPELGQVRIDVRMHEQLLTMRIQTQTAAGQDALQSRLADLRSALEQHGVQLGHVSVELRPPGGPENQFHDSHQHQGGNSHGEFHPGGSGHSQPQDQSPGFGAPNSSSDRTSGEPIIDNSQDEMTTLQKRVDLVA